MNPSSLSTGGAAGRWISYRRDRGDARLRLFCFPYAGGGASAYRRWQSLMPPTVDVCPVQPPGRENRIREPAFNRTEALVEALDTALRPTVDRPFVLFGYSMGATIAFEWAHLLRRAIGREPELLIVAARAAPHLPRLWPQMYRLPDEELKRRLQQLDGTPPEILSNDELMEILLPLLRADFEIHDTYRPEQREPLSCPVVAFGGLDDHAVPEGHLQAWADVTSGEFRLERLPGDHFGLLRDDRMVQRMATMLQALADR